MSQLTFIRSLMYQLKQEYGDEIGIYRIESNTTDLGTGIRTATRSKKGIRKAIILPNNLFVAQTLSGIGYTRGMLMSEGERMIIVDHKDLPKDFEIKQTDYIVYEHKRYEIVSITDFEKKQAYLVKLKILPGIPADEIHDKVAFNKLILGQSATHE